jgi:hypothetical protein
MASSPATSSRGNPRSATIQTVSTSHRQSCEISVNGINRVSESSRPATQSVCRKFTAISFKTFVGVGLGVSKIEDTGLRFTVEPSLQGFGSLCLGKLQFAPIVFSLPSTQYQCKLPLVCTKLVCTGANCRYPQSGPQIAPILVVFGHQQRKKVYR